MSEEEREAIETLSSWCNYNKRNRNKLLEADKIIKVQETILNLIEKQQKELEEYNKRGQTLNNIMNAKDTFMYKEICKNFIPKEKIKERVKQTQKVYEKEINPYLIKVGVLENVLDVTGLSKREKQELINKRNCLLVQIKTYEDLLEEK